MLPPSHDERELHTGEGALSSSAPLTPGDSEHGAHPFATPESARYSSAMLIGRGGMGRVVAVFDARLGREVARKDVPPGSPGADGLERRLAREAWITARLDHPGIVAVHDAGTDPSGRPYFTMRLIRGRSLDAALAARDLATATLLRHFLAVCQAIAHAHARGVVHRDIKPHNVMLGPFGETQVVDWGVARLLDEVEAPDPQLALPAALSAHTVVGARVGTSAWMAPEQARGEVVGPHADVFSLGLVLRAIMGAEVSPEASAILERALAQSPADRYPDAGALAADVAAWLDGRRVSAFSYSTFDLARRFYRAFRAPLLVGAAALVAIAIVLAVTLAQTRRERDRALDAEAAAERARDAATVAQGRATAALEASERAFADLLLSRSIEAVQRGARAEAELLAAHTLARRPDPAARGALARFAASEPARVLGVELAPTCSAAHLAPRADMLVCLEPDALSLWDLGPLRLRWRLERVFDAVAWLTPSLLLARTREHDPRTLIDATTSVTQPLDARLHVARVLASEGAALADDGEEMFVYSDGGVRVLSGAPTRLPRALARDGRSALTYDEARRRMSRVALDGGAHVVLGVAFDSDGPMSAALAGERAAFGGVSGTLRVFEGDRLLWSSAVTDRPIVQTSFSPDGAWLATRDERGTVMLHATATGQSLPLPRIPIEELAWRGTTLVTLGAELRTFALPGSTRALGFRATAGIAALALDARGERLALADGRGAVSLFEVASGRRLALLPGDASAVAKDLAFTHDGLALAISWPGQLRSALWSFDQAPRELAISTNLRRLVARADGELLGIGYGQALTRVDARGQVTQSVVDDGGALIDLVASGDGREVAYLTSRGNVAVLDARRTFNVPDAHTLALDHAGHVLAVATSSLIQTFDLRVTSAAQAIALPDGGLVALALAPEGGLIAAGTLQGRVLVFDRSGRLLVDGRDHTQRVADLAFLPSGKDVISASWDGTAARWHLDGLDGSALVGAIERTHGLGLEHALRADLR